MALPVVLGQAPLRFLQTQPAQLLRPQYITTRHYQNVPAWSNLQQLEKRGIWKSFQCCSIRSEAQDKTKNPQLETGRSQAPKGQRGSSKLISGAST